MDIDFFMQYKEPVISLAGIRRDGKRLRDEMIFYVIICQVGVPHTDFLTNCYEMLFQRLHSNRRASICESEQNPIYVLFYTYHGRISWYVVNLRCQLAYLFVHAYTDTCEQLAMIQADMTTA